MTRRLLSSAALAFGLMLSACGTSADEAGAGDLDKELLADAKDPAMTGALEDQIMVDPDLTEQSNKTAVAGVSGGVDGSLPSNSGTEGGVRQASAAAAAEFPKSGMMSAPVPTKMSAADCKSCDSGGMTLGAKADAQLARSGVGACDANLSYDMGWANRMPAEFKVYPRANVKEAAGVAGKQCNVRVVNFTTKVGLKSVVDYYYSKAKNAGYSAEYVLRDGDHILGGTRDSDDGAYIIFLETMSDGGTEVNLVANNGG